MCFFTKLNHKAEKIEKHFKAQFEFFNSYKPQDIINGFDFPKTPVIKNSSRFTIEMLQWGLVPDWANDDWNKSYTLNARKETIHEKPAFKNSHQNRCLVITNGFYEWQHHGKIKTKYEIGFNDELFAFGGIYDSDTYSIVTTEAQGIMREIHNTKFRMPIALKSEKEMNDWLNGELLPGRYDFEAFPLEPLQLSLF